MKAHHTKHSSVLLWETMTTHTVLFKTKQLYWHHFEVSFNISRDLNQLFHQLLEILEEVYSAWAIHMQKPLLAINIVNPNKNTVVKEDSSKSKICIDLDKTASVICEPRMVVCSEKCSYVRF